MDFPTRCHILFVNHLCYTSVWKWKNIHVHENIEQTNVYNRFEISNAVQSVICAYLFGNRYKSWQSLKESVEFFLGFSLCGSSIQTAKHLNLFGLILNSKIETEASNEFTCRPYSNCRCMVDSKRFQIEFCDFRFDQVPARTVPYLHHDIILTNFQAYRFLSQ